MINLKPCPFCGSDKHMTVMSLSEGYLFTVCCRGGGKPEDTGCGADCGHGHHTAQDAIKAWNTRKDMTGTLDAFGAGYARGRNDPEYMPNTAYDEYIKEKTE